MGLVFFFQDEQGGLVKPNNKKWKMENYFALLKNKTRGFPRGAVVESLPADAGDTGSSPGPGRSHMLRSN